MNELINRIQALLGQDLMLAPEFKQKVLAKLPSLSEQQLQNIVKTLEGLVNEETEVLTKVVEENPYFFIELQHKILEVMHQDFDKREQVEHQVADKTLKTDLHNFKS